MGQEGDQIRRDQAGHIHQLPLRKITDGTNIVGGDDSIFRRIVVQPMGHLYHFAIDKGNIVKIGGQPQQAENQDHGDVDQRNDT